jgi:hypothetical protein
MKCCSADKKAPVKKVTASKTKQTLVARVATVKTVTSATRK